MTLRRIGRSQAIVVVKLQSNTETKQHRVTLHFAHQDEGYIYQPVCEFFDDYKGAVRYYEQLSMIWGIVEN